MKNSIIHIILLIILCIAFLAVSISSYASTISLDLKDNFFRLHILANSDSVEDQALKLKVRDRIIEYMELLSYENMSKEDAIKITNDNLINFKTVAEKTIHEEGYSYPVNLEIGTFYFPTKNYANLSLPAGYYDGLKIEIGEAKGQNWWCSLFPPLCFVDVSSGMVDEAYEEDLKENLSGEEFAIITGSSKNIKLKFKLVELFSK